MDVREIRWEVVDRTHLAQYRNQWPAVVNMAMSLHVPQNIRTLFLSKFRNLKWLIAL
jgi:hypothetical protein